MRQYRKSTVAAIAGLGALTLLTAPVFAAGDHSAGTAKAPVQFAHMSQGGAQTGQPCPMGMTGPGTMGPGYGMGSGMGGNGMMGSRMMGSRMTGPGMMGPGMDGQHMMGPGSVMGYGMMRPGSGGQVVSGTDLSAEDVRHFLEHRLEWQGNKRVKVGDVKETDDSTIVAEIVTVDGSLVQRLTIDRHTGAMQQAE